MDDDTSDIPDLPTPPASRRFSVRDLLICVGLAMLLLVLFEGHSIRHAGEELKPGWQRTMVLAVGHPAGWVSDELYLDDFIPGFQSAELPSYLGGRSTERAERNPHDLTEQRGND